ncbi:hypothetical protein AMJ44_09310 [candidate division WOR-1 bacterium DG_54_3]|uniref:Uncharacterized protein n=1 Tax=candidate division WOR-1 bacterium DG_54_3 TaxID=1703775 RepID=A0A0S7XTM2_UNCSA|nr:MAG: hypothetical protein AMJ44_09310 [candidate division WOR-1 bacterium DG_54_3]
MKISFRSSVNVNEVPRSGILTTRIDAGSLKSEARTPNWTKKSSSIEFPNDELRYEHAYALIRVDNEIRTSSLIKGGFI